MQTEPSRFIKPDINAPLKIRGFLIVVAIGLVFSFLKNLESLGWSLSALRRWQSLTTPGLTAYHPYWKPVLLFGVISNSATLAINLLGLLLFFRKHRFFPTYIVVAIPIIFVLTMAGYYLEGLVPAIAASQAYGKEGSYVVLRFISMHVWIPYFVISERVKRTFVR